MYVGDSTYFIMWERNIAEIDIGGMCNNLMQMYECLLARGSRPLSAPVVKWCKKYKAYVMLD